MPESTAPSFAAATTPAEVQEQLEELITGQTNIISFLSDLFPTSNDEDTLKWQVNLAIIEQHTGNIGGHASTEITHEGDITTLEVVCRPAPPSNL